MCKKLLFLGVLLLALVLSSTANAVPHNTGEASMLCYFKFDGNWNDSSGNAYHGSIFWATEWPSSDQIRCRDGTTTEAWYWTGEVPGPQGGPYDYAGTAALRIGQSAEEKHGQWAGIEIPNEALVAWQQNQTGEPTLDAVAQGTVAMWIRPYPHRVSPYARWAYLFGLMGGCGNTCAPASAVYCCPAGGGKHRIGVYLGGKDTYGTTYYTNELGVAIGDESRLNTRIALLNDNQWYHVALALKANTGTNTEHGTYKLYVDGAPMPDGILSTWAGHPSDVYLNLNTLLGAQGSDPNDTNETQPVDIGNQARDRTEGFRGYIDEFAIYTRQFSRIEIAALADADANKPVALVPPNKATNVVPDTTLGWMAGITADSHDVYLGTTSALGAGDLMSDDQTGLTFDPCGVYDPYLNLNATYYWRVDENNSVTGTTTGDVWNFVTDDGAPTYDYPKNWATGQFAPLPDLAIQWTPAGAYTTSYDLYLSQTETDVCDVTNLNTNVRVEDDTTNVSYTPSPVLTLGARYYWRLIGNHTSGLSPASTAGPMFVFEVANYYTVEDFEEYATETGGTPNVIGKWDIVGTIAAAELIYLMPDTVFFPTVQSLDIGIVNNGSPYYSGIARTYATYPDYSINNTAKAMSLWYKADSNTNRIYAAMKDSGDTEVVVTNTSPVTTSTWTEWNVAFTDFTSVSMSAIKALEIGEGDRASQSTAGASSGALRVDDIRLYMPRYLTPLLGDVSGNKIVNWDDLDMLTEKWLSAPVNLIVNPRFTKPFQDIADANIGWFLRHATNVPPTHLAVLAIDANDGVPAPCGRLDQNQSTTSWTDHDFEQILDVSSYNPGSVDVYMDFKGCIQAPDNTMFEYRLAAASDTNIHVAGATVVKRTQRAGSTICADCYGAMSWDWEAYSSTFEVTHNYMHITFRLCSRGDTTPDPAIFEAVDNVVVVPIGASLPPEDIDGDTDINFLDYALIGNDWYNSVTIFP